MGQWPIPSRSCLHALGWSRLAKALPATWPYHLDSHGLVANLRTCQTQDDEQAFLRKQPLDWHPTHGAVSMHQAAMCSQGFQLDAWLPRLGNHNLALNVHVVQVSGWLLVEHRRRDRYFGVWHRVHGMNLINVSAEGPHDFWLVDPQTANWVALVIRPAVTE